jgi:hypothetical protein
MTDRIFAKRLADLTDEAIRRSLAEIQAEFDRRFGPTAPSDGVREAADLLKMLLGFEEEAASRGGITDCIDNAGHPYQSEAFEALITHARMLVQPYDHAAALAKFRDDRAPIEAPKP